ncbi:hypothetical protein HJC23_009768 [Cyclotella cryptica]|uniref:Uncharacterized protein n=1 Tax=Cyclotella cryptica TaxID=29204 RepID=A0ABD3PS61_9STRA
MKEPLDISLTWARSISRPVAIIYLRYTKTEQNVNYWKNPDFFPAFFSCSFCSFSTNSFSSFETLDGISTFMVT